jgi:hypothetical protein
VKEYEVHVVVKMRYAASGRGEALGRAAKWRMMLDRLGPMAKERGVCVDVEIDGPRAVPQRVA